VPVRVREIGLACVRNRYPTDVYWLDIRAPTRFRGNWFPGPQRARPSNQGPARQRLLEMLCDAFQRGPVREGQGSIGLRVHSQAAKPPKCLVGMDERKAERIRDIVKDDDQRRDALAALRRPTLNIFSSTKLFPRQIVSKTNFFQNSTVTHHPGAAEIGERLPNAFMVCRNARVCRNAKLKDLSKNLSNAAR
jgi:hypothetical protein